LLDIADTKKPLSFLREVFRFDCYVSTKETLGRNTIPKIKNDRTAIGNKGIKVETANRVLRINRNVGSKIKRDGGNIG